MSQHLLIKPDFPAYLSSFIEDMRSGKRQTVYGRHYSDSSIQAARQTLNVVESFRKSTGSHLRFKDLDMDFYQNFVQFLYDRGYSTNSIGKYLHAIKTTLACAQSEGLNSNPTYLDKRFRAPHVDTDNIYLTLDELERIASVDLSKLPVCYEQARDMFLVGVWTAQRVSDFSKIRKENIHIEDDITVIELVQQKTGKKVSIPCNSALTAILEKYDYRLPHVWAQHMNRYIKKIGQLAGLEEPVCIKTFKGGRVCSEIVPKYSQIKTHTARRTGATLMYLSGVDAWDIMQITGHSSPTMLKKYIKANELDIARKIKKRYEYFK